MPTLAKLAMPQSKSLSSADLAALLAQREAQAPQGLQDIFGYIDNQGTGSYAHTPNGANGDNAGLGSTGLGLSYADPQANNGADGNQAQAPVTFKPPEQYAAGVTLSPNSPNGEGSGGYHFNVDPSKFPQTRFGNVTNAAPVGSNTPIFDRRYVYDDPNYGQITFAQNVKPDKFNSIAQAALMSAAMAGMGYLVSPAALAGSGLFGGSFNPASLGIGLVNGARGLANGGSWTSLLSALGGPLGLPSWSTTLAQLAAGSLGNRGGKG